jgi:hypothetical protein
MTISVMPETTVVSIHAGMELGGWFGCTGSLEVELADPDMVV